ncbi:ribonuclease H1-like [Discoglossus pictus]
MSYGGRRGYQSSGCNNLKGHRPQSKSHDGNRDYSRGGSAEVYIDGCCFRNGQDGARGGLGVFWDVGDPRNVSCRLEGRPTNQRAEIEAARTAVEQAREDNITRLIVNTDSKFTTKGMTEWVPRWKENGWKTIDGRDVINREDFERLDQACEGMDITWKHVPGHSGNFGMRWLTSWQDKEQENKDLNLWSDIRQLL